MNCRRLGGVGAAGELVPALEEEVLVGMPVVRPIPRLIPSGLPVPSRVLVAETDSPFSGSLRLSSSADCWSPECRASRDRW